MPNVKIGVSADGSGVSKALDQITASLNKLGAAVSKVHSLKFEPADVSYTKRDLDLINRQFQQAIAQSAALRNGLKNSGQTGRRLDQVDFSRLSVDPRAAQRMRDRAFQFSTQGTAWDLTNFEAEPAAAPSSRPTPDGDAGRAAAPSRRLPRRRAALGGGSGAEPDDRRGSGTGVFWKAGRRFFDGIGGGVGKVGGDALEGAAEGAEAGGLLGGLGGFARVIPGAALAYGAFKVAQAGVNYAKEGYGMAKDRDLTLDTLKRQMGDLGVSFDKLKGETDGAAAGLGVNNVEMAKLEAQYSQASHNAERTPEQLRADSRTAVGFARAYGLDPSQATSFFGGMRAINPRQNNRELAVMLAEAIQHSGGRALPEDVMAAMQSLSASTARMSLIAPDAAAEGDTYASLVKMGVSADNAEGLLGTANAAMMRMGGVGEASQNFTLQAFNAEGGALLNPVMARALAAGGLGAMRSSTFASDSVLGKYFGNDPQFAALSRGHGANISNLEAIQGKLNRDFGNDYAGKSLRLDAAQNFFQVSSPQQAAALLEMSAQGLGSLGRALSAAGVSNLDQISVTGYQTLAKIGDAHSMGDLNSIYSDVLSRTGDSALSDKEKATLSAAQQTGNVDTFRKALLQVMAGHDQEDTTASDQRKSTAALESMQADLGGKLVPVATATKNFLAAIAGKLMGQKYNLGDSIATDQAAPSVVSKVADGASHLVASAKLEAHDLLDKLKGDASAARAPTAAPSVIAGSKVADAAAFASRPSIAEDPSAPSLLRWAARKYDALEGRSSPIGVRNNNPFDMRPWKAGQNAAGGFLRFGDMQSGVTAGLQNLVYAEDGHGRDTLRKIISAYAPSSDGNNTAKYIADVAKATGIGADQKINLHDPKVLRAVSRAMLGAEGTSGAVSNKMLDAGIQATLSKIPDMHRNDGMSVAEVTTGSGAQQTIVVDANVNLNVDNGNGSKTVKRVSTSVAVPRGSGTQQVSVNG
jgi:hypothetical protein